MRNRGWRSGSPWCPGKKDGPSPGWGNAVAWTNPVTQARGGGNGAAWTARCHSCLCGHRLLTWGCGHLVAAPHRPVPPHLPWASSLLPPHGHSEVQLSSSLHANKSYSHTGIQVAKIILRSSSPTPNLRLPPPPLNHVPSTTSTHH